MRCRQLERELVQQNLRSILVEQQVCHEQLKSANEKLQSTNLELDPSKDELESANEEGVTVNAER